MVGLTSLCNLPLLVDFPLSYPSPRFHCGEVGAREEDQGAVRRKEIELERGAKREMQEKERMEEEEKPQSGKVVCCCLFVDNAQDPVLFMSARNLAPSVTKSSRKA